MNLSEIMKLLEIEDWTLDQQVRKATRNALLRFFGTQEPVGRLSAALGSISNLSREFLKSY